MTPNNIQHKVASLPRGNLLIASEVGSGKTYAAYLHAIKYPPGLVIWTTPLKAIASEMAKLEYLKQAVVVVGDSNESFPTQGIVITTPEKALQQIILNPALLSQGGLVIIDECHLLGFSHRGPKVEALILMVISKGLDVCLMSGTVNPQQWEEWLTGIGVELTVVT
jgi:replicative superfamily II helicase